MLDLKSQSLAIKIASLKPSAQSIISVAEDYDFYRWRRKLAACGEYTSKILVADDDLQYQTCQKFFFVAGDRRQAHKADFLD